MVFDQVWRLRRSRQKTRKAYADDRRKAKSSEERERIADSERYEVSMIDDDIATVLTQRLAEQALKLDLPFPYAAYEQSSMTGKSYIDTQARFSLSQAIRKERKERREHRFGLWKDVALLLTAVAAFISSLVAIYKHS